MGLVDTAVFDNKPTTNLSEAEAEVVRDEYQRLLDRALEIEPWPSGHIRMVRFATPEDGGRADELSRSYYLTFAVHPSQVDKALRAIAGLD